jgi:hypothetical protein
MKHSRGIGREPIGHAYCSNPFFDTREYDAKFMDRTMEKYATNVIAGNMYAQVDNKGKICFNSCLLEIMDHKKDGMMIHISDSTITSANGNMKPKIMTKGWMLLVMWKDWLTSWVKLKDLKA